MLASETEERYASDSSTNSADDPAVHRGGFLLHEACGEEGVDLSVVGLVAAVLGAGGVDKLAVELEGDDRGEGVRDDDGALLGDSFVASLVFHVVADDVLASFSVGDLVVVDLVGDVEVSVGNGER